MATAPAFISTPRLTSASTAAANTNIDGSGSIVSLMTGVAAGTRVLEVAAQCSATSAAGLVNLFISNDSGTTWTMFDQITITAATVSATVKANRNTATYQNLILPSASSVLGFASTIAQRTNVFAMGGDLT